MRQKTKIGKKYGSQVHKVSFFSANSNSHGHTVLWLLANMRNPTDSSTTNLLVFSSPCFEIIMRFSSETSVAGLVQNLISLATVLLPVLNERNWRGGDRVMLHARQRGVGVCVSTSIIFILKVLTAAGRVGCESVFRWMRIQEGFYILKLLDYAVLTWNSLHCDNCVRIQLGQLFWTKINKHSDTV